jgi:hypothetical protein
MQDPRIKEIDAEEGSRCSRLRSTGGPLQLSPIT